MKYLSICSGIEAASVAWHPLNWQPVAFSEIEPFPSAVLAHHFPHVPNLGDMTQFASWPEQVFIDADVIVGGCPCQAFSVAGLRGGVADARGNLTLVFIQLVNHADEIRRKYGKAPVVIVYENVPGLLSSKDGAFGSFLGGLAGSGEALQPPGGRWADAGCVLGPQREIGWRILDAQHFGLAQRRRRVFLVAGAGEIGASKILFERTGVRRDPPPSGQAPEVVAALTVCGVGTCGPDDNQAQAGHLIPDVFSIRLAQTSSNGWGITPGGPAYTLDGANGQAVAAPTLATVAGIASTIGTDNGGKRSSPRGDDSDNLVVAAFDVKGALAPHGKPELSDLAFTLKATDYKDPQVVAFGGNNTSGPIEVATARNACSSPSGRMDFETETFLVETQQLGVRRITPRESERLQGFPDDWTLIPWGKKPAEECPDGHRQKAIGNSMAVPCMVFVGKRINGALMALYAEQRRSA